MKNEGYAWTQAQDQHPTILIIDDNPANLQVIMDHLANQGYDSMIAHNGSDGIAKARLGQPDLILLDVRMPGIDGFETCCRLKSDELTSDIPVIFMTGLASETEDKVKGFEAGGVDYITKPLRCEEVFARIRTHLTIRCLQRQLQEQNRQLEQQNALLEKEKTRFQTLSEATFEGIVFHDDTGILEVNSQCEQMFGYTHAELTRKHLSELIDREYHKILTTHLNDSNTHACQIQGVKKSGEHFPLEIQTRIMPSQDGEVRVTALRDLSWVKTREQIAVVDDKLGEIIGKTPIMQKVYELIVKVAKTDETVSICGETGTGKGLIAKTIHKLSRRKRGKYVYVNCGAVPETLFESELFGHLKGAFTGADKDKSGYFEQANGGTIFLDEVGELSLALQVKLLRVLEEKKYRPLGAEKDKETDVRIITATNRNLTEMCQKGLLREDFFYRISVIRINVEPLRKRKEDIPFLIDHFLEEYSQSKKIKVPHLPARVREALCAYDWPGNVRQLQNVLQRYLTTGDLDFAGIRQIEPEHQNEGIFWKAIREGKKFEKAIEELEKQLMVYALAQCHGKRGEAAAFLNMPDRSFRKRAKDHNL